MAISMSIDWSSQQHKFNFDMINKMPGPRAIVTVMIAVTKVAQRQILLLLCGPRKTTKQITNWQAGTPLPVYLYIIVDLRPCRRWVGVVLLISHRLLGHSHIESIFEYVCAGWVLKAGGTRCFKRGNSQEPGFNPVKGQVPAEGMW